MRIWAVIVLIVGTALPGLAQQQVSVAQLETILTADRTSPDADLAAKLSELILTERFSAAHLEHWRSQLPGPRSERALLGVADPAACV